MEGRDEDGWELRRASSCSGSMMFEDGGGRECCVDVPMMKDSYLNGGGDCLFDSRYPP